MYQDLPQVSSVTGCREFYDDVENLLEIFLLFFIFSL